DEILLGHDSTLAPSRSCAAPKPPFMKKRLVKLLLRLFASRRTPDRLMHHRGEPMVATTFSGISLASAVITIIGMKWPISGRGPPAAGGVELSIDPSGAVIVIGRNTPSLLGIFGDSTAFTPYEV